MSEVRHPTAFRAFCRTESVEPHLSSRTQLIGGLSSLRATSTTTALCKKHKMVYFSDPILFQNARRTLTVVDIPTSISAAQIHVRTPADSVTRLYSRRAIDEPWPSTEPKSDNARLNVVARTPRYEEGYQHCSMYSTHIERGLEEIKDLYHGEWCLPRHVSPIMPMKKAQKRKRDTRDLPVEDQYYLYEPVISFRRASGRAIAAPIRLSSVTTYTVPDYNTISHRLVAHNAEASTTLDIMSTNAKYHIPPLSAFFLANIDHQSADIFSLTVNDIFSTPTATAAPGQFDVIVLDPPWQNRSVRRSGEYNTIAEKFTGCQVAIPSMGTQDIGSEVEQNDGPIHVVRGMLGKHIAPTGLVACWITNKASVREKVTDAFKVWDVDLIEEWTWLKLTTKGEPVYDIEGLWRKPYEIVMLGRKRDTDIHGSPTVKVQDKVEVTRRMIFGVPDFHSRKPCLKTLIEQMMPDPSSYRALEIFARNLTAGWWSWGDEVLKFNWESHWTTEA